MPVLAERTCQKCGKSTHRYKWCEECAGTIEYRPKDRSPRLTDRQKDRLERNRQMVVDFFSGPNVGNPSTAAEAVGLSRFQGFRVIQDALMPEVSVQEAGQLAELGRSFVLYAIFQVLGNKEQICQIFDISRDQLDEALKQAHQMLLPEYQGDLGECWRCQECQTVVRSARADRRKYCDECKSVVAKREGKQRWQEFADRQKGGSDEN